jgi:hypothetical protein
MRNAFIEGYHGAADGVLDVLEVVLSTGPTLSLWGLILILACSLGMASLG